MFFSDPKRSNFYIIDTRLLTKHKYIVLYYIFQNQTLEFVFSTYNDLVVRLVPWCKYQATMLR